MSFDLKAFDKARFEPRTADVSVPELKEFFGEGDEPIWTVRNMTGPEMAKSEMAGREADRLKAVIEGITSNNTKDIADAVKGLVGGGDDMEPEFRKQLAKIVVASVDPKITKQQAVKLADVSPSAFYRIVAKINDLSGKGAELGKLKASTETKK